MKLSNPFRSETRRRLSPWHAGSLYLSAILIFAVAWWIQAPIERPSILAAVIPVEPSTHLPITVDRGVRVTPLHDEPSFVSDRELTEVLRRIVPRFPRVSLKPNHVEHALRTWGADAVFDDPDALSGAEMVEFLTDHGAFIASWTSSTPSLLVDDALGVSIRCDQADGGSVHHDHLLASLTEAGVLISQPVSTPATRDLTFEDILQQALIDFRPDEWETEWSTMAFAAWLTPSGITDWKLRDGRSVSFDMLARRLLRGHFRFGVCSGTHRVYSLMALIRMDDEFHFLSSEVRESCLDHLETVRDRIISSQNDDGSWPPNWWQGEAAHDEPADEPFYKTIIATGHHLEWLAIAPRRLHPPREQIRRAAAWIIEQTTSRTAEEIQTQYTFYSHVGSALALWRGTSPARFWQHRGSAMQTGSHRSKTSHTAE